VADCNHGGMVCTNRHPNHNPNTTWDNCMDGNPRNIERIVKPRTIGLLERIRRVNVKPQQQQQRGNQYGNFMAPLAMPFHMQTMSVMPAMMQQQQQQQQQQPPNMKQYGGNMMSIPIQGMQGMQGMSPQFFMPTMPWGM